MRAEMAVSSTEHSLADFTNRWNIIVLNQYWTTAAVTLRLGTFGEKDISRDLEETRIRKREAMKEMLRVISTEAVQGSLFGPFSVR